MTVLAVLAIGLGVIPLAAILLYSFRGFVLTRREAVWGFLAGVLAFLALGHAMAAVLVNKSLFGDTAIAIAVAFVGLAVGAGIAWLVLEGPFIEKEPNRILWVAVAFLGLHSLGDGLVLGRDFVGGVVPSVQVDGLTVGATVAHRFVEGCLVVVPAIWGAWKARPAFALLLVSLASVLAAYIPGAVFSAYGSSLVPSSRLPFRRSSPRSRRALACFYSSAGSSRLLRRTAATAGPGGRPWGSSRSASSTSSSSEAHAAGDPGKAFAGQRETSATMRADASVAVPRARWIVTTTQSFSEAIVSAPTATCVTRIAKLMTDSVTIRISGRNQSTAAMRVDNMKIPVNAATRRWMYSTRVPVYARFGTNEPLHRGQSGHASPAFIPRTVPPTTIVAYAQTAPKIATT